MSKKLVAYFSASGVTAKVAETLAEAIGADIFEIEPKVPYTEADLNWMDKKARSTIEMSDPASRPEIAVKRDNMKDYDISSEDGESGSFGTQGECHPRRCQNAQSRVWSASAIPVLADHRLSCVSCLKTPFFRRIASKYCGFWATKKEGLLLTPNWRRNKPSSFTM